MVQDPRKLIFGIVSINGSIIGIPITHLSEVCHVEELSTLPIKNDLLLGGFELRKSVIPVLNFHKVCGFDAVSAMSKLMVVISNQDLFLAFSIDEVLGIAQTTADEIQLFGNNDSKSHIRFSGVFAHDEHFVSVLDIEALFERADIFAITRRLVADVKKQEKTRTPMLVFETGGALFSIPAVDVYAAVPRQEIIQTAITGGPCLGEVTYYNRRIPVVCPIAFLGVGAAHKYTQSQVVVLTFPNGRLLGLAVDSVQTIESFANTQEAKMPLWLDDECFIKNVTARQDQRQIFEIDLNAVYENSNAQTLASFSDQAAKEDHTDHNTADNTAQDIVQERKKYLVVKAGKKLAIPLEDVSYILEPPVDITPTPSERRGFKGYFSRFGQSVALFDLCAIMKQDDVEIAHDRLLLTGQGQNQVAFYVEKVIGIEQSEWREAHSSNRPTESVVKIATTEPDTVLPYLRLATLLPEQRQPNCTTSGQ